MGSLISGVIILVLTAIMFWYCLPRGSETYRFADTEWEPYVGVAFCSAVALSCTMMLSGVLNLSGAQ